MNTQPYHYELLINANTYYNSPEYAIEAPDGYLTIVKHNNYGIPFKCEINYVRELNSKVEAAINNSKWDYFERCGLYINNF